MTDVLAFIYVDEHGEVTERTVCDWVEDDTYIHGHCLSKGDTRTFRKDRIEQWLKGEEHLTR